MRDDLEVLLVAPYDRYPSITRFVQCLEREISSYVSVRTFQPPQTLARFGAGRARKWFEHLDRFIVVPRAFARAAKSAGVVHLSDQSLAIYTCVLKDQPQVINCHDLIAVRAALGEFPEFRPGWKGRRLQHSVLRGLKAARQIVCLADSTRDDVLRLTVAESNSVSVIPMGLHRPFRRMAPIEAERTIASFIPNRPFILHVGGNQWYKNRKGVLDIYREIVRVDANAPALVLVGEPPSEALRKQVCALLLEERVHFVTSASDDELGAFYSAARALLFPSHYEGFGWPIIEAQSCGCPVVTSDRQPMTEVAGKSAVFVPPNDPAAAAGKLRHLLGECEQETSARVEMGMRNAARFSTAAMVEKYLKLYSQLALSPRRLRKGAPAFA